MAGSPDPGALRHHIELMPMVGEVLEELGSRTICTCHRPG